MYTQEQMSVSSISKEFGVCASTLDACLRRNGVEIKPRGKGQLRKASKTRASEAVAAYAAGLGCETVAEQFGVTSGTVLRWVRAAGAPVRPKGFRAGELHVGWKGGRRLCEDGYVLVLVRPDDPFYCMAQKKMGGVRYALEHRIVMARHLGRVLESYETVHHIDGDRAHNPIENLQLRHGRHGKGSAFRCADCGSYNVTAATIKG